jgi:K+-sensing histidine kinase KdpD
MAIFMRQDQKEKKSNDVSNSILINMSHELRTQLNVIVGFVGILLLKFQGPLNAEQEKHLNIIKTSTGCLLSLINNLVDIAKIESKIIKPTLKKISCLSMFNEVKLMLTTLLSAKESKMIIKAPSEDVFIYTDSPLLIRIMINLVEGVMQFSESNEVVLKLEETAFHGKKSITITIDAGTSINKKHQEKLLLAYQKIDSGNQCTEEASLGLYLSQQLVALLNGKIEFESEEGKVGRFLIILPSNE